MFDRCKVVASPAYKIEKHTTDQIRVAKNFHLETFKEEMVRAIGEDKSIVEKFETARKQAEASENGTAPSSETPDPASDVSTSDLCQNFLLIKCPCIEGLCRRISCPLAALLSTVSPRDQSSA